jgi:hypothetical protein
MALLLMMPLLPVLAAAAVGGSGDGATATAVAAPVPLLPAGAVVVLG